MLPSTRKKARPLSIEWYLLIKTSHRVCTYIKRTKDATWWAGYAYPSGESSFTLLFLVGLVLLRFFFLFSCYICKTFVCLLIFLNFLQYRCQFLFDLWVSINVPLVSAPLFCSRLLYTKIVYPVHESSHRIQVVRDWVNMISCFTTPHKAIESKELFLV